MLNWLKGLSLKVGGPQEKRNLLGVLIDGFNMLIRAPFGFWVGLTDITILAFTNPKEAGLWLSYQGARVLQSIGGLFGVRYYTDFEGKLRWNANNFWTFLYVYLLMQLFTPIFLAVGWKTVYIICLILPPLILMLTGLRTAIRRWKWMTFEDYLAERKLAETEEQIRASQQRTQRSERLATGLEQLNREIQQLEAEKKRQERLIREAEERAKAYNQEHNKPLPPDKEPPAIDAEFVED